MPGSFISGYGPGVRCASHVLGVALVTCVTVACSGGGGPATFSSGAGGTTMDPSSNGAHPPDKSPADDDTLFDGVFVTSSSFGTLGAGGESGEGGGSGGGSGSTPILPLVSVFCADFVRDPVLEDCDAGPEGSPACNEVCQTLDFLLVEPPEEEEAPIPTPEGRVLGTGRHPSAATEEALAVGFVEHGDDVRVRVQLLDVWGNLEALLDVSDGAFPVSAANPVVAALPDGRFAVAFNDFSVPHGLTVTMRSLDPEGPALGALVQVPQTSLGAQYDPDIVVVGNEVILAWTDTSDALEGPHVMARRFDTSLQPLGDEMVLGGSPLPEGNVVLAPFGESWAAAWREAQVDGSEEVVVFFGGARWDIAVDLPGPSTDKPALVALDDEHLFVGFTVGTDPLEIGVANTPRLYGAVVDTVGDTVQLLGAIEPLEAPYAGSGLEALSLGQSQPDVAAVGERFFVTWTSEGLLGDAGGQHLWLKELVWDDVSEELSLAQPEISLARWEEHTSGDQARPALAPTPLIPEGALLVAWEDYGVNFHPHQGRPDIVAQIAPVPLRRGPPVLPPPEELWVIDDLEDGDGWIVEHDGRVGEWFIFNDGTGTQTPAGAFAPSTPGRESNYAVRTTGSGFSGWGAGVGLPLNDDGTTRDSFDASDYEGITFWARAESAVTARFNVFDGNTDQDGGVCSTCFDHFGADVQLTTSWQQFTFAWDELEQDGWGNPQSGAIDPSQLYGLAFQFGPGVSFDLWIDDVAFLPVAPPPPPPEEWLIDDFEDGDGWIAELDGRTGPWFVFNDGTGSQTPSGTFAPATPGRSSNYAARTTGSGFTSWGAGIGFELNGDGSTKDVYDAGHTLGVTFWARAESAVNVRFGVADVNTDPEGGVCSNCFDHFGIDIGLTTSWQQYTFTWGQLQQQGWGDQFGVIDPTQLYVMQFQVGPNVSFDVWLDDIAFVMDVTELVDDLEDEDDQILAVNGRQGWWFTYNDGTSGGSQTPAEHALLTPDSPGFESDFAARTFGSGFTSWGASLAVELNNDGSTKATYDASDYIGVSFWARAAGTLPIRFMVADANTDSDGGICSSCFDHFGADITLSSSWQRYTFTWWQLAQQGWGDSFGALDFESLFAFHFQTQANASFDVWVDDLALIVGGGAF